MTELRKIVVTGATRGLGRALVDGFAALGHAVAGCGRSNSEIDSLNEQFSEPHLFDVVDVTNEDSVRSWAEKVISEFGVPDLLINNAATINRNEVLWKISAAEFDSVVDVNIKGVANVIRYFVPAMVEAERGVIVNLSSGWGRSTSPEVAPYCSTKYAIEGLTKALAQELPPGMAAVPLNPGIIDTEMLRSCFGSAAANHKSAAEWKESAVPMLLKLGPADSGESLTVSGG